MMSYLWILLLGGLLATGAKAQDAEEPADAPNADSKLEAPEVEPTSPADDDAKQDETDTEPEVPETMVVEEVQSTIVTVVEAEPTTADDAEPTVAVVEAEPTVAVEETEPTVAVVEAEPTIVVEETEPTVAVAEAEPTIVVEETEPTTAEGNAEPAAPIDGDAEEVTPVADVEVITTPEPEVDPEDDDAEDDDAEVTPTPDNVEHKFIFTERVPVDESEPDYGTTTETAAAADNDQDESTDPPTNLEEEIIQHDIKNSKAAPGIDSEDGLNLYDGVEDAGQVQGKKNSRMVNSGAQSAVSPDTENPQTKKASSGTLASILCAIGVAAVGAVTGYFTYQRKQLCFKSAQEADPEAGRKADAAEAQSDPQALNTLLNSQTSNQ